VSTPRARHETGGAKRARWELCAEGLKRARWELCAEGLKRARWELCAEGLKRARWELCAEALRWARWEPCAEGLSPRCQVGVGALAGSGFVFFAALGFAGALPKSAS